MAKSLKRSLSTCRYDIWTGWAASGNPASSDSSYEIVIWLSGRGGYVRSLRLLLFSEVVAPLTKHALYSVQPIGQQVQCSVSIAGHNWNLWQGPNANWEVLSFVSADGDITDFNADLKQFFGALLYFASSWWHETDARPTTDYLQWNYGVSQWQYIQAIQTGTKPFTGSASLFTNNFNVALNHY